MTEDKTYQFTCATPCLYRFPINKRIHLKLLLIGTASVAPSAPDCIIGLFITGPMLFWPMLAVFGYPYQYTVPHACISVGPFLKGGGTINMSTGIFNRSVNINTFIR